MLAIAGPTASGKSALALRLAEALGGWIINADASQVYRELRILSARPTPPEEARVPHRLYGTQPGDTPFSAGAWRRAALGEIAAARAAEALPILCGGSGLYLKALEEGLAETPPVPPALRAEGAALLARLGAEAFHARLAAEDPAMAARLSPQDPQRLLRAWSVRQATGRSLADWQREAQGEGQPLRWLVLLPPREDLREAVATRWAAMLAAGALAEVRALLALDLDPALPVMKAVGVRELAGVLRGEWDLAQASQAAITATRQYLKRQTSWLRTQVLASHAQAEVLHAKFSTLDMVDLVKKVRDLA